MDDARLSLIINFALEAQSYAQSCQETHSQLHETFQMMMKQVSLCQNCIESNAGCNDTNTFPKKEAAKKTKKLLHQSACDNISGMPERESSFYKKMLADKHGENSKLRERNRELQYQCKTKDKQIKELEHIVALKKQQAVKETSSAMNAQTAQYKITLEAKNTEIQNLKKSLDAERRKAEKAKVELQRLDKFKHSNGRIHQPTSSIKNTNEERSNMSKENKFNRVGLKTSEYRIKTVAEEVQSLKTELIKLSTAVLSKVQETELAPKVYKEMRCLASDVRRSLYRKKYSAKVLRKSRKDQGMQVKTYHSQGDYIRKENNADVNFKLTLKRSASLPDISQHFQPPFLKMNAFKRFTKRLKSPILTQTQNHSDLNETESSILMREIRNTRDVLDLRISQVEDQINFLYTNVNNV